MALRGSYFPQFRGKINPGLALTQPKIDIFMHAFPGSNAKTK
jgi:hypothetical protein